MVGNIGKVFQITFILIKPVSDSLRTSIHVCELIIRIFLKSVLFPRREPISILLRVFHIADSLMAKASGFKSVVRRFEPHRLTGNLLFILNSSELFKS